MILNLIGAGTVTGLRVRSRESSADLTVIPVKG